jgi:ATP-binding protein involved in chromosome partitioning
MSVNTNTLQQAASLEDLILARLSEIHVGNEQGPDIVSCGQIYDVVVTDGAARILLDMSLIDQQQESALSEMIAPLVESIDGVQRVVVKPRPQSIARRSSIPGIQHVIGVHSGKGGVGKSTLTANLAVSLSRKGYRVGLLDADVYGPSAPTLLGLKGRAEMNQSGDRITPMQAYGVKVMSLGFLLPEDQALIWRGSLVDEGLPQLFNDIDWGELDVLLVDLPPGTSDVHLSVAQSVQLSGVLTVTAPGQLSIDDVRRGLEMFADIAVPSLGLVENMAGIVCHHCQHKSKLFGEGGAAELSEKTGIPLLISLPFIPQVAISSDSGLPVATEDLALGQLFHQLADSLISSLKLKQQGVSNA